MEEPPRNKTPRPGAAPQEALVVDSLPDNELVGLVKAGNTDAFRLLVDRHSNKAYWTAYNIVHSHEDSQDIAQEAFVRVYRFLERYDPSQRFTTWFYQIVVNLSIDALRRRKPPSARLENVPEAATDQLGPTQKVELQEKQEKVHEVLSGLPEQYRVILVLRDIEGLPSRDVAKVLNMNHATVRWRLHRARAIFKETWESRYGAENGP